MSSKSDCSKDEAELSSISILTETLSLLFLLCIFELVLGLSSVSFILLLFDLYMLSFSFLSLRHFSPLLFKITSPSTTVYKSPLTDLSFKSAPNITLPSCSTVTSSKFENTSNLLLYSSFKIFISSFLFFFIFLFT